MKKNLKFLIPTLLIVVAAQFFLVRFYLDSTNAQAKKVLGEIDTTIPHPSESYDAREVVQVVTYALRHNDSPRPDAGLAALWQFMTPRLRTQLRDKALVRPFLKDEVWVAITDFDTYEISREKTTKTEANFELKFLSKKRLERRLVVALKKTGELWLVDMLATP